MSNNTAVYEYDDQFNELQKQNNYSDVIRMLYIIAYTIICTVGLVLNLLVIIRGCCYHRRSDTAKWVLALAVTHWICSAFLPLQILYSWYHFNWHYGTTLCKLSSYIFYTSMFSTAGILTMWSITDKGKCCTTFRHSSLVLIMILTSWTFASVLSIPSLYSREVRYTIRGKECIDDYDLDDKLTTNYGKRNLIIVVCFRFLLGILVPGFVTAIGIYCRLHGIEKSVMRIACLIKVAHFVSWTPLLVTFLLQAVTNTSLRLSYVLPVANVLAAIHCSINPVIYLLVSRDIKMQWMKHSQDSPNSCI